MKIDKMIMTAAVLAASLPAFGQSYRDVLEAVASNNPAYLSKMERTSAGREENLTGLTLPDPELDFSYQWGTPGSVPDKIAIDVTQRFLPSVLSGSRSEVARRDNDVLDAELSMERNNVCAEADRLMTELAYYSRLGNLYEAWDDTLTKLEAAAAKSVEMGKMSAIDYNAIRMELLTVRSERTLMLASQGKTEGDLMALNGGNPVAWPVRDYMEWTPVYGDDAADWVMEELARSAYSRLCKRWEMRGEAEVTLRKRERLPEFSVGYTNELVAGDNHHGFKVGTAIPLWSNRGRVKAARAALAATRLEYDNGLVERKAKAMALLGQSEMLARTAAEASGLRSQCGGEELLSDALERGRISVVEYLGSLLPLIEVEKRALDIERDYQLSLAELRAVLR